jgi:hypothetical protein
LGSYFFCEHKDLNAKYAFVVDTDYRLSPWDVNKESVFQVRHPTSEEIAKAYREDALFM